MAKTVVEVDGVGKRYLLGEHHGAGPDLRETLARWGGRARGRVRAPARELWSLRDVSFTVDEGEAMGVIGSNGAGKSTLLKVISSITTPTVGRSRTRGRVGSLLEVGTGFHGELTGIENTYLNGAILGMSRRQVGQRLEQIVEFAGLERFMDTPVKRYSSGMYLRLGFAIAAHMDAEILVVDEVLAVGDAEFQRRCLGRMGELERSGRTVLFVSHNLDAMARLCPRTIWLDHGVVCAVGATESVIDDYIRQTSASTGRSMFAVDPTRPAQITSVAVTDDAGRPQSVLTTRSTTWIDVEVMVHGVVPGLDLAFIVSTAGGIDLLDEGLADSGRENISQPGRYRVRGLLPPVLAPGDYTVSLWLGSPWDDYAMHERVATFSVEGDPDLRTRRRIRLGTRWEATMVDPGPPPRGPADRI